jgi:HSP20 family protein
MSAIIRRDSLGNLFDDFFSDYFTRSGWPVAARGADRAATSLPRLDVVDRGDSYAVTVDLPGVKKQDINITVEGSRVAIKAETKAQVERKDGDKLLYTERTAASFARSFELPAEVSEDKADASYENGVLQLVLPKRQQVAGRRLDVR